MSVLVSTSQGWLYNNIPFDWIKNIIKKHEIARNVRITIEELSKLSDNELKDIGISRGDIYSIAHEVYYNDLDKLSKGEYK